MAYSEEEYLQLSGIQHFAFCRRQWALAYLEQQWSENILTAQGRSLHKRAHDASFTEKRGDLLITRDLPVFSASLGVSGSCDVVEFRQHKDGIPLFGRDGLWLATPIEYKRGTAKENDADRLQLCCQAMCLEEMLCTPIAYGSLFYGENRRREKVPFTDTLRDTVRHMLAEMHDYRRRGHTPKSKPNKSCKACSLRECCVPKAQNASVERYWQDFLGDLTCE
ncbi:CRISPR-associated protein Cas4 [Ruminococcaceae bacterium OttesenSCG-928-L11]|nr:CRISPR-associated protein Cas4 [Ruminococcaceae bacterium OttesenSCG-928-L11]